MGKIFICYSHKDEKAKDDLVRHLDLYNDNLEIWHDRNLSVGDKWKERIIQSINECCAAILLVSIDFLISKFITEEEIPRILKRIHNDNIGVFPLIISPCDWQSVKEVSSLQVRPVDGKSLASFKGHRREQVLVDFAKEVKILVTSACGDSDEKATIKPIITSIKNDNLGLIIDKKRPHILDQINSLITTIFKEVNFYPIHLLINNYPFKNDEQSFPYYTIFTLATDNEELFGLLESIKISPDKMLDFTNNELIKGVKKHEEKTKKVLRALSNNLIFNLENRKTFKRININYPAEEKCNCVRCRFARFDFSGAFKELSIVQGDLDDKFKLAYTHYQVGNFLKAEKQFKNLSGISEKRSLNIRNFITQFNLSKLSIFIRNHYWGDNNQDDLVQELKNINLNEKYTELSNPENEKLLDWIKSIDFLCEGRDKIQNVVAKIRDHYYLQLNGGSSRNNHASELINEYAAIETFLNQNYIIYDGFSEFHGLTEVFIEGLIVSHSIKESQSGRLEHLDDWLLKQILVYGKADSILKYIRRYNLKEFKYKQTSSEGDSFIELINNFLIGHNKTRRSFKKYCEDDNRYFWDKYNIIFSNLMVMAGLLTLNRVQTNEIADKLLKFLKIETSIQPYNYKHVRFFIVNQSKLIKKSTLKKFLLMSLSNKKTHEIGLLETIIEQLKSQYGKIELSQKDFKSFMVLAFDTCPVCKHKHSPEFIVLLYQIIDDEKKRKELKKVLVKTLNEGFSENLYHMAAIYGILEAKGDFFERLIELAKPAPNKRDTQNLFMGKETRYPSLSMLINICYKYDINLSTKRFNQFKGIFPYYDWLMDMKSFEYDKFNPQWISEYSTKYYLKEMRKHKIVTRKVCEYLKNNRDPLVERYSKELICSES